MAISPALRRRARARRMAVALVASLGAVDAPAAPPGAAEVFASMGFSAAEQQRMLAGEFVVGDVKPVTERDLSVSLGFLVKTSPEDLARRILLRELVSADPQVRVHGELRGRGDVADFAALRLTDPVARAFREAKPGDAINLSSDEIAAFRALPPGTEPVQRQLATMLLERHRAYLARGLAGIAPFARRDGRSTDGGADLRSASDATQGLAKYLPAMQQVLLRFPDATIPGLEQVFTWADCAIEGSPATFVLTHLLAAPDGDARVVVQRQYYVSAGYHAEQAVAGFLPVKEGTLVAYTNHTFTDQVAGFGGAAKRGIGRRMLARTLQDIFTRAREMIRP